MLLPPARRMQARRPAGWMLQPPECACRLPDLNDGLFGDTGSRCDVPEGMAAAVEPESLADETAGHSAQRLASGFGMPVHRLSTHSDGLGNLLDRNFL